MGTKISGTTGVTFPDNTNMQTGSQACKAWVNFNGTGTVAIRAAYNVSSITDNGVGSWIVNFTEPLTHNNYVTAGNFTRVTNFTNSGWQTGGKTTSNFALITIENNVSIDSTYIDAIVFA